MPTPPRSYSPAAAEKLRLALLALAATAATTGCDRVETALGLRTTGVTRTSVPEASESEPISEPDDIILGGEAPIEPATDPIVTGEDPAIANPDVLVRGEPPMMPVPSTNATSSAPVPIELTEADLKKLDAAGFDVSAATNAPAVPGQREAGSVPEALTSGPAPIILPVFRTSGRLLPEP